MAYTQPTLYARHEPTNDSVAIQYLDAKTLATCQGRNHLPRSRLPPLLRQLPILL